MKKYIFLTLISAFFYCCTANAQSFKVVNSAVFADSLQMQQKPLLLDVRTPEEFAEGHLKNALNYDFKGSDFKAKIGDLDKAKTYYVYCRSGKRSAAAVAEMRSQGFKTVYELEGGMLKWVEDGMQTVKEIGE